VRSAHSVARSMSKFARQDLQEMSSKVKVDRRVASDEAVSERSHLSKVGERRRTGRTPGLQHPIPANFWGEVRLDVYIIFTQRQH
jgi:hypothetical protein